jgi:hypothetical protein
MNFSKGNDDVQLKIIIETGVNTNNIITLTFSMILPFYKVDEDLLDNLTSMRVPGI